jgi:mannobiose 2-epimerase
MGHFGPSPPANQNRAAPAAYDRKDDKAMDPLNNHGRINRTRDIDHSKALSRSERHMNTRSITSSRLFSAVACVLLPTSIVAQPEGSHAPNAMTRDRDSIASEMRSVLDTELARWFPLTIDTALGGYFSDVDANWHLDGVQNKMIVTQSRDIWSAAKAARFYQRDTVLRSIAAHGFPFLRDRMWDKQFGGFYDLVDRSGEPVVQGGRIVKTAYGNAFALYGLAAYYNTSGDTNTLQLARKTFLWLDSHSRDSVHGGYFQFISREGVPFTEGLGGVPPKDQNSSIHLLESLTELYRVWPDPRVRERLTMMLTIVRDTITTSKGYLVLFFHKDWTPVSFRDSTEEVRRHSYEFDHVSFGHDVETAYLMLDAADALGMPNDSTTLAVAKKMVDHALSNGWDRHRGGIFDGGYYETGEDRPDIVRRTKEWWAQAEALNSFLLMSELFPDDEHHYFDRFCEQWQFCKEYVIDGTRGGWYWGGIDVAPNNREGPKGTIWKATYHTSRSMMNCIRRLLNRTSQYRGRQFGPVNPHATPQARNLLAYLYSLHGRKIIAGHHNWVTRPDTFPNRIYELTGKRPEIWGTDFIDYYKPGIARLIVDEAFRKYREGYIITLMWHAGRPMDDPPFDWKKSILGKLTEREWIELTTPGTPLNVRWMMQVDTIASYLKDLQKLGVPVLWRPYHELNGVWFWWGNRKGVDGSAKLWRMMYDRFVNYHKLGNLIWVWNANAPRQLIDDEAFAYKDFFPGVDCVDVLAADVYHDDYEQSHHDELVELGQGKIIALGEVGEVPTPQTLENQPMWTWFMLWANFVNTHNSPEQVRRIYAYPGTITHEKFTRDK